MAAKNSMFEPEDTDILQDMYGTDAGRLTEQQEDMFGTVRARPPGKAGGQRRFCWPARQLWCCFGPRPSLWKVEVTL